MGCGGGMGIGRAYVNQAPVEDVHLGVVAKHTNGVCNRDPIAVEDDGKMSPCHVHS